MSYPQPAKQSFTRSFDAFGIITFTIGTEGSNTINVAMVFKDARGNALAAPVYAKLYLSDSSDGHTLTATVTTSPIVVGTNGVLIATPTATKAVDCITDTVGRLDLNIIQTAAPVTYYLVVVMPDGSLTVSGAITFA